MITSAIEKILSLSAIKKIEIKDKDFSDRNLHWIKPSEFYSPDTMNFSTLTGMVDFIKDKSADLIGLEGNKDDLMIVVDSPLKISLHGKLQMDNNNSRFLYAESKLVAGNFGFGTFYDLETFIIALQSQFVPTNVVDGIINMCGNLANEKVVTQTDDKFSQKVQISSGITTKSEVVVTNPVVLQPYRTFREIVPQPESSCIMRFKERSGLHVALFISDGDAWKLEAVQKIKAWLNNELGDIKIIA